MWQLCSTSLPIALIFLKVKSKDPCKLWHDPFVMTFWPQLSSLPPYSSTPAAPVSSVCFGHPMHASASGPLHSWFPLPGPTFTQISTWLTPLTMSAQYSVTTLAISGGRLSQNCIFFFFALNFPSPLLNSFILLSNYRHHRVILYSCGFPH